MKNSTTKHQATAALVPKLRFPEFRGAAAWESGKVDDLIDTVTPPKKLPTAAYALSGKFPIIDQSQSDICGWTDDDEALIDEGFPLVIFGDHTCILKLIDRPFAQGADGIKILKTRPKIGAQYLYQFLSFRPVVTEEYKRHFSILKEKVVFFPDFKSGEQQKIADCLSSVDELISAQARKVDALKTHKKGLMQQLFPREGETEPRLRFPEFQNAREWEEMHLGDYFDPIRNGFVGTATPYYTASEGVPYLQGRNIKRGRIEADNLVFITSEFHNRQRKSHLKTGDILMVQSGHVGECSVVGPDFAGANCHALVILTPKRKLSSEFFAHYFYSPIGGLAIFQITTGNTIKHILASELKTLPVLVPDLAEQQRIASCLSSLDTHITAATQALDTLKTHKQGLMQQLFPSSQALDA